MHKSDKDIPIYNDIKFVLLMCVTLGLAPFYPEPHILGKLRWVAGGGNGMAAIDYLDLFWHGLPWVLLIRLGSLKLFGNLKKETSL